MFPRLSGITDPTFHASSSTSDIEATAHPEVGSPTDAAHIFATPTPNTTTTPGRAQAARPRGLAASLKGLLIKQQTPEQRAEVRAWSAARSGNHEKLQGLLAEHPDLVFRTDRHGQNLLSVAARAGQRSTAITVLSYAATQAGGMARIVNQRNAKGETPLFLASSRGHADVVSALLGAPECDVNAEDKHFRTPLHKAVKEGHAEVVELLLADSRIASGLPDVDDNTPLHLAVSSRPELVKTLAAHPSAVPNAVDKKGMTALERAIDSGRQSVVADLLSVERVDASSPGKDGLTPFWRALRQFKHDIEGSLGSTRSSRQMLQTLANSPRVDMSGRAPGAMEGIGGHTPLTLLCSLAYYNPLVQEQNERYQRQIAEVMTTMLSGSLRAGNGSNLDPNAKDLRGRTPLQLALTQGKETETTLLLNDPRTDPNVHNGVGQSLLEIAATHGRPDWAQRLLSNPRTNPNLPMSEGAPLLARAMNNDALDWGRMLLRDRRTDPNVDDVLPGRTLLLAAAELGKLDWAQMLYQDKRTDHNALATLLTLDPRTVHTIVGSDRPIPHGPAGEHALRAFKEDMLARWADTRRADGKRWPKSTITNMRLGEVLAERERQGASSSSDCRPGAVFRFGLALELALEHAELIHAKEAAGLLLRHAPRDQQYFNLRGVDVSRTEIESWAAGKFSEGIINRTIEGQIHAPQQQNVHLAGLNARGAYILSVVETVIRESAELTAEDRLDAASDVLAERVRAWCGTAAANSEQPRINPDHLSVLY